MERSVAAAVDEEVDIAGKVEVTVPTVSACWAVRLLLLYLSDRPTSDCFREVVWLAVMSTHPPSLAGGRPLHLLAEWTKRGQSGVAHVRGLIPV